MQTVPVSRALLRLHRPLAARQRVCSLENRLPSAQPFGHFAGRARFDSGRAPHLRPVTVVLATVSREEAVALVEIVELPLEAPLADGQLGALCDAVGVSA